VRVLVIGYNAFDVIVPVRGLPPSDSKQPVPAIHLVGGGPGATAAVALARLGAEVRFVTVFGDDRATAWQRSELAEAGVDVSLAITAAGHQSPRAVSLADPGSEERTILWTRGALPAYPAAAVDEAWLEGVDLLYTDSHEPAAAGRLARAARERKLPVVLDAGSVRAGMVALVAECSDVISSAGFATELTAEESPDRALRALRARGPGRVALTQGARGCLALVGDDLVHVPAFAIDVRDTTGAGDAFHAGYAFARAEGRAWLDCLRFGAAVAALKCRDWGGRAGLPTRAEAEQLLQSGATRTDPPLLD
jgi:sugar/nucleoside kinase (ribokinase family)